MDTFRNKNINVVIFSETGTTKDDNVTQGIKTIKGELEDDERYPGRELILTRLNQVYIQYQELIRRDPYKD